MDPDPRAKELNNLRRALKTFTLHLDSFQARLNRARTGTIAEVRNPASIENAFASHVVEAMKSRAATDRRR